MYSTGAHSNSLWIGSMSSVCVALPRVQYIALYKKAVGQEATGSGVEEGTLKRMAALEADMDGVAVRLGDHSIYRHEKYI